MTHTNTIRTLTAALTTVLTLTLATPILAGAQAPAIEIKKLTNGEDCDEAPGITVPAGETVTWTYVVTNQGGSSLYNITLADSTQADITCPGVETLHAGEMMTCVATMVAPAGPFRSQGLVAAVTSGGVVVDDSDPEHQFGDTGKNLSGSASITIEKLVNGIDADTAPGPSLIAGGTATWTYEITNTGSVPVASLTVTDSQGADVTCLGTETLQVGESTTCVAYSIVTYGPDRSLGLATAVAPDGTLIDARDPSYHVGI